MTKRIKWKVGLYQNNSHHLVPITDCLVQQPTTQQVMNTAVQLLTKYSIPIYNEKKNSGILRTLMARIGIETGEVQLVLISKTKKFLK